jgi:TM2 domain-containing membrane protein YozV
MALYCTKCGSANEDYAQMCAHCQAPLPQIGGYQPIQPPPAYGGVDWRQQGADKKIVAGLLGVLAGGFGIHKFILGYTTEGIIQIVITFVTCGMGSIIGLIEGIIYLTKSDEDFVRTYIQNKKGWF